jgi:hypothetical protein
MKPWEETWVAEAGYDPASDCTWNVSVAGGRLAGSLRLVSEDWCGRVDGELAGGPDHDDIHAIAALAAAAPDLYRALAAIEWVEVTVAAYDGNHDRTLCPSCQECPPYTNWKGEPAGGGHKPDCALDAALRKARGET